jgi:hypothetical protein
MFSSVHNRAAADNVSVDTNLDGDADRDSDIDSEIPAYSEWIPLWKIADVQRRSTASTSVRSSIY